SAESREGTKIAHIECINEDILHDKALCFVYPVQIIAIQKIAAVHFNRCIPVQLESGLRTAVSHYRIIGSLEIHPGFHWRNDRDQYVPFEVAQSPEPLEIVLQLRHHFAQEPVVSGALVDALQRLGDERRLDEGAHVRSQIAQRGPRLQHIRIMSRDQLFSECHIPYETVGFLPCEKTSQVSLRPLVFPHPTHPK